MLFATSTRAARIEHAERDTVLDVALQARARGRAGFELQYSRAVLIRGAGGSQ